MRRSQPSKSCRSRSRRSAPSRWCPVSHIFWSHLWLGIATDAFDRARAFVRASSRQKPGEPVPAAIRLSHLWSSFRCSRAEVARRLHEFIGGDDSPNRERLSTMGSGLRFNNTEDRCLRAGAAYLPGRDERLRDRRFQERHPVQCGTASPRHNVRPADDRERANPPDERVVAPRRKRRLSHGCVGAGPARSFLEN